MSTSIQGEGGGKVVDVDKFLAENKLERAKKAFLEREIAIEELVEFDEDELMDFAKDLGLDTLQKRRFVKAILSLRPENQGPSTSSYRPKEELGSPSVFSRASSKPLTSDLHHVMLSRDENKATKKLFARVDKTMVLGKELEGSFRLLTMASQGCEEEIKSQIDTVISLLEDKKKQLLNEIDSLRASKEDNFKSQVDALENHRLAIVDVEYMDAYLPYTAPTYPLSCAPFPDTLYPVLGVLWAVLPRKCQERETQPLGQRNILFFLLRVPHI